MSAKQAPQGAAEVMRLVANYGILCADIQIKRSVTKEWSEALDALEQTITAIITERDALRSRVAELERDAKIGAATLRTKVEELPSYRGVSWAVNRNDVLALIDKMGGKV